MTFSKEYLAGIRIARVYRLHLARTFVLGLTAEKVMAMTCEEAMSVIKDPANRAKFGAGLRSLRNTDAIDDWTIKAILMAYMFLFPRKMFETIGPLETMLMRSSSDLIESLTSETFSGCFARYSADYREWSANHQARLLERFEETLRRLHGARRLAMDRDIAQLDEVEARLRLQFVETFGETALAEAVSRLQ